MAGPPGPQPGVAVWPNLVLFLGFYALLVLLLGLWSRVLARRVAASNFHKSLRRFNNVMLIARLMVPIWFTIGVYVLGWGAVIATGLGPALYRTCIGVLLGTVPAFMTWMGLWWSQYPADRALKEQNLLSDLDNDLPLYQPPPFRSYFSANLRVQVLFTIVPVLLIVLGRDALMKVAHFSMGPARFDERAEIVEMAASIIAAGTVFLFVPALLRRVLSTEPLSNGPLRDRLVAMCRQAGIRYREILLWKTHNNVGNAAVMGVLPQCRYVLLSDVLLERMSDEEVEAVFAHELGHVVHRHMIWYAIFFVVGLLAMGVGGTAVAGLVPGIHAQGTGPVLATLLGGLAFLLVTFGALSRRCERQADVYAARTMEMLKGQQPNSNDILLVPRQLATVGAGPLVPESDASEWHVGRYGAWLFAAALRRVAAINNIPISPRQHCEPGLRSRIAWWVENAVEFTNNWLHGSIAGRMQYLQDLSADPRLTSHFDRSMFWLNCGLLFALFTSVAFAVIFHVLP
ncbi:MAG: Zn-dependent protease with chaperone function [Gemmatimonadales bacterium]|nr:Zn-dependent protease with chaperone function [Gemmatimonadales bacterium]MDB5301936.1 Zn-dependent protease with chaperone function [Phycisphaerales bacterium]